MTTELKIIQSAEFNPKIKVYLLLYVAFILTMTVVGIPLLVFWFLGLGQYICRRFYENLKCDLTVRHLEFKKGISFGTNASLGKRWHLDLYIAWKHKFINKTEEFSDNGATVYYDSNQQESGYRIGVNLSRAF